MAEVAALGLKVDGVGNINAATSSLDKFSKSADGADRAAGGLTSESRNTSKSLADVARAGDKSSTSMSKLAGAAKLAAGAFAGIKLTSLISDMTMANSRFEQLGLVMGVVGRNASLSQDQVNAYAKEVEAMGISMTESRQTVIRMTQAQMDLSRASELARLAQDAAVIANTNSSDALGRLIYGLQSGQVEILRNMGLNVNFAASYSKLAAEMGVTTNQLSEVDKVQARTNAVMEAGIGIAGAYDASMENAGKQLGSTTRYLQDLGVMWGEVFSEAARDAIFGYSDALKGMHNTTKQMSEDGTLESISKSIGTLARGLVTAAKVAGTFAVAMYAIPALQGAWSLALAAKTTALKLFTAQVVTATGALGLLQRSLALVAAAFAGWQIGTYLREEFEFVEKIGISLAAGFQKTFATLEGQMQKIGATIGYALSNPLDLARTKIIDFLQFLASLGGTALDLLGLGGMMDGITARLDDWRPETEAQFRQALETIEEETKEKIGNIDAIYADMFANVGREAPKAAKAVEDMGKDVEDMGEGGAVAVKKLGDEITRVQDLFDRDEFGFAGYEDAFDPELFDPLMDAADTLAGKWERATGSIIDGLGQVKDTMAEGSKEAQTLGQAMQALQVVQGIAAILNQGMGDPYTAIGRMAAMAAAVASLIGSVGFAGSGNTTAADAQATQGTGGVLGDAAAQSESIQKGVDITADATSALVGINRAQLVALEAMRDAISGASNQILRGGGDFSSSDRQWNVSNMIYGDDWEHYMSEGLRTFLDPVTVWADKLLGGSSATINSGIEIAGGRINDLIDNTVVSAFQDVESKKHFLDSKDVRRFSDALGDDVGQQFALVFGGMVDAVSASAEVLGFTEKQIGDAINSFRVAATEISLMDLTGEEQNAAISAVFSDIFDDLATTVIPFIGQFQQAGEGMAETLIRIATQVQVTQEAVDQLGLSILDGLGPEQLARVSDELITLSGGMEKFITGFTGFVDKFATDEHKMSVATNAINSAMSQLGLEVPQSEEALWELMQTLTDPAQIAGLLRLQDSFATMFDMMDKEASQAFDLNIQLLRLQGKEEEALALIRERALEGMSESNRALQEQIWTLQDLEAAADAAAQAAQSLADFQRGIADQILGIVSPAHAELERLNRAMGAQIERAQELGIAEEDLANMRRLHQLQLLEFAAGLEESIASLSDELFGTVDNGMDRTVNSVGEGMNRVRDLMIRGIAQVNDWLQSSMLSNVSPLTPEQRLAEAESQFFDQIAAAQGGDASAISGLSGLADQLLSEASGFFGGSTAEFDDLWMRVRGAMEGVAGLAIPDAVDPQRAIQTATESTAMSALQQITLASDMIGQIAALSRVTGETPADIAERLGVPIGGLLDILESTPGEFAGAMDQNFNDLVNGFGMTIDPLLSVQNAQLEATKQQTADTNERLERIEQALLDGVNYQRATAVNTGETANQQGQAVAIQRRNENKPSGAGRINV